MARASLNWPDADLAAARVAASAAGLSFNRWLARAARETAAMERAVIVEDARVGLEREGWDDRFTAGRFDPSATVVPPSKRFAPDFKR